MIFARSKKVNGAASLLGNFVLQIGEGLQRVVGLIDRRLPRARARRAPAGTIRWSGIFRVNAFSSVTAVFGSTATEAEFAHPVRRLLRLPAARILVAHLLERLDRFRDLAGVLDR